jgi:hypothetical protein
VNQCSTFGICGTSAQAGFAEAATRTAARERPAGVGVVLIRLIRHAMGFRSIPTDGTPISWATTSVVPAPQKGSSTTVPGATPSVSISAWGIAAMNFAGYG